PLRSAGEPESMEGGTSVDAGTVKQWLSEAATALREQRDYLTQLDAAIGDADHGANMDRGFTAVVEKLDALDAPPGKLLTTAGSRGPASTSSPRSRRRAQRARTECARRRRCKRRRDVPRISASAASGTRTPARPRQR